MTDHSVNLWRFNVSWGPKTVRPMGLHKIGINVIQIVTRRRRYFCVAWPLEWQGE